MHGIDERVALVTGAASGIGRATAHRFADEGARVVIADVDVEGGEEAVEAIEARGGEATFVETDVSDPEDAQGMVEAALDAYGRLDFAHNNAGFALDRVNVDEKTEAEFDDVTDVNLKGVWLGLKAEIPAMLETGGGAIVNTSSVSGLEGEAGLSFYSAAKHGVVGLTRSAALEYAEEGVRINAVCPGGLVNTEAVKEYREEYPEKVAETVAETPMDRVAEPEEIASTVAWLCSDDASFVTGHPLVVDGGNTVG